MEMDTESESCTPESKEAAENVISNMLPDKSAGRYTQRYEEFTKWCDDRNVKVYTEKILLAYFYDKSKIWKSPSLWSAYSMIKSMLLIKHNIEINKFYKLVAFLKKNNQTHEPTKSKTFTWDEINKFLSEAPDKLYLLQKVLMIFGISGACGIEELRHMTVDHIHEKAGIILVKIGKKRQFMITDELTEFFNPVGICKKYLSLRKPDTPHKSLFVQYRSGSCTAQPTGIHSIGKVPYLVASYLKLTDPSAYSGHAFRRTAAILFAGTSTDIQTRLNEGGRKNERISFNEAQRCIETSVQVKEEIEIAETVLDEPRQSTSVEDTLILSEIKTDERKHSNVNLKNSKTSKTTIIISNNNNCSINFYF